MNYRQLTKVSSRFFCHLNCRLNIPAFKYPELSFFRDLTDPALKIKNLPKETMIYVGRMQLKDSREALDKGSIKEMLQSNGDAISHFYLALSRYIKQHEHLEECKLDISPSEPIVSSENSKPFMLKTLDFLIADLNRKNIRWGIFNTSNMDSNTLRKSIDTYRPHLTSAIKQLVHLQNLGGDIYNLEVNNEHKIQVS
jgi:hypothetical protein